MTLFKKLFNIIGFQAGWWACVLGVQNGYAYLGPLVMSIFIIIHIALTGNNRSEIIFIIAVGLIGLLVDTALLQSSLIAYEGLTFSFIAPIWIIAMWMGFSATLNHSLSWLDGKWIFAFLLGAVFGPLSYLTGTKFGAIDFQVSLFSITILAFIWGGVVPILFFLNRLILLKK